MGVAEEASALGAEGVFHASGSTCDSCCLDVPDKHDNALIGCKLFPYNLNKRRDSYRRKRVFTRIINDVIISIFT